MAKFELKHAAKKFGRRLVVSHASFQLSTGEILGLFGSNGSGKSTLLKMIYGSLKASTLQMFIDDKELLPDQVVPKECIAYVPQHPFLPPQLKVRDVIPIYFEDEAAQDKVFFDTTIAGFTHQKIGTLSHGQRKYFEVVLTAHLSHPFLMLDEPFSMLEPLQIEHLKDFLKEIATNKGILITDHYYQDVLDCADRNIVLHQGVTQAISSKEDLVQFEYLSKRN